MRVLDLPPVVAGLRGPDGVVVVGASRAELLLELAHHLLGVRPHTIADVTELSARLAR